MQVGGSKVMLTRLFGGEGDIRFRTKLHKPIRVELFGSLEVYSTIKQKEML